MIRWAAIASLALLTLVGCSAPPRIDILHVHGLHYDAATDSLFVATHHGLAKGEREGKQWSWNYLGEERYDFMGFSVDGNQSTTFYSSGHPDDPYEYGGTSLGLRRSTDGGITWEQRSLKGRADFHALTGVAKAGDAVIGWANGQLMASGDGGLTWTNHTAPGSIYALAATDSMVWAGTDKGLFSSRDGLRTWQASGLTGAVISVATSPDGKTVLASLISDRSGVYVGDASGSLWQRTTKPELRDIDAPILFGIDTSDSKHIFAADDAAHTWESRDRGATWTTVR
jgi:hypothetical protein